MVSAIRLLTVVFLVEIVSEIPMVSIRIGVQVVYVLSELIS